MSEKTFNNYVEEAANSERKVLTRERLSKKELRQLYLRYQMFDCPGFNYTLMQGQNFPWNLKPLFKKYYDKEEQRASQLRHFDFYNTEHMTGSLIWGMVVGMEEQRAVEGDISDDIIRSTKVSLAGPCAGIGDSIVQSTILAILATIGVSLCGTTGSILGPLFYILGLFAVLIPYTWFLFSNGYKLGRNAIGFFSGSRIEALTSSIEAFGLILLGCLTATTVKISTPLQFMSNNEPVALQGIIDGIFPGVLRLGLVALCYWMIKKKRLSFVAVLGILIVATIAFAYIGIL